MRKHDNKCKSPNNRPQHLRWTPLMSKQHKNTLSSLLLVMEAFFTRLPLLWGQWWGSPEDKKGKKKEKKKSADAYTGLGQSYMSNTFELCDHHVVVIWMHGRNKNANIWIYWHTAGCFSGLCSSVWGTEECKPVAFSISQCWWTNWQCGAWWFFYDAKTLTISYYRSAQYSIVTEVWFLLPSQGNWIRSPGLGYYRLRSDLIHVYQD